MKKCEFKRLQDKCRAEADVLVEKFSREVEKQANDPNSPVYKLIHDFEWNVDREFMKRIANGEHLPEPDLPLCKDVKCTVCYNTGG